MLTVKPTNQMNSGTQASALHGGNELHFAKSGSGFALIFLLILISVGAMTVVVNQLSATATKSHIDAVTAKAFMAAKTAIIGWSALNGTAPGKLPCPEDTAKIGTGLEGQAATLCSNSTPTVGRLPWKTLGVDRLIDGYGEPLWYALSPGFRVSPINAGTPASLTLDGIPHAGVAIVFSPGPPLSNQHRPAFSNTSPPQPGDYLDLGNGDGDFDFISRGNKAEFNDQSLAISSQELAKVIVARVAGDLLGYPDKGLKQFFSIHGFLPCAATAIGGDSVPSNSHGYFPEGNIDITFDSATKNMLDDNHWFDLIQFDVPGCGTPGANTAVVSIGMNSVRLNLQ